MRCRPVSTLAFCVLGTVLASAAPPRDWIAYYTGPAGFFNIVWDATTDGAGNSYVTGESATGNGAEIATVKYDSSGNVVWVARYLGRPGGSDRPFHVTLDGQGNVIVAGQSDGVGTFLDFVAIKLDGATGARLWAGRYDGPAGNLDSALGMALDGAGNVHLAGQSWGGDTGYDVATVRLDALTGGIDQQDRYDGGFFDPNNGNSDAGLAIAVDAQDSSYVAGWQQVGRQDGSAVYAPLVLKYNADGEQEWASLYDNGQTPGQAVAVAVGPDGAPIFVAAVADGYLVGKLDPSSGNALWSTTWGGPAGAGGTPYALALDHHGNPLVTGGMCISSPSCLESIAVVKLDGGSGAVLWSDTWRDSDPQTAGGSGRGLAVDCRDNVFVTGFMIYFGAPRENAIAIGWSSAGERRWVDPIHPDGSRLVSGKSVAVDSAGSLILAGTRDTAPGTSSFMTIRYESLAGDLNADNCVQLDDLARLLANFGGDNATDVNCDGLTDLADLAQLLTNFGACLP